MKRMFPVRCIQKDKSGIRIHKDRKLEFFFFNR